MTRFLIVGLPRSGTTYLMTLLNSHRAILCEGEQFNPYRIVGAGWGDDSPASVQSRDRDPVVFLKGFFAEHARAGRAVGCKWMIGHHVEVMRHIPEDPELRVIYVHRQNRLAQAASLLKALRTRQWAARDAGRVDRSPLAVGPRALAHRIREMEVADATFAAWLEGVPNRVMTVEYRQMFAPGFEARVCGFLGVDHDPKMASPLVRQGAADVLARFADPGAIRHYFTAIGRQDWLEPELADAVMAGAGEGTRTPTPCGGRT